MNVCLSGNSCEVVKMSEDLGDIWGELGETQGELKVIREISGKIEGHLWGD